MAAREKFCSETLDGSISTRFGPQVLEDMGRMMEGTPRPVRGHGLGKQTKSNFTTKSRAFVYLFFGPFANQRKRNKETDFFVLHYYFNETGFKKFHKGNDDAFAHQIDDFF